MAYDNNSQLIIAPNSVYDVQRILNNSSSDLGTLCRSAKINKWAKYKPVGNLKVFTTDELENVLTNKTWKSSANWWKGIANFDNYLCGLAYCKTSSSDFNYHTSLASLVADIENKTILWSYVPPTGGVEPYRIMDFNEYKHDAMSPTYAVSTNNVDLQVGSTLTIMIATSPDDGYCLKFSHIGILNGYYYTAAIYDTDDNSRKIIHSNPTPLSSFNPGAVISIDIPKNDGVNGGYEGKLIEGKTYKVYVFLSSREYNYYHGNEYVDPTRYVGLPCGLGDYGLQPATFLCRNESQFVNGSAKCNSSERMVQWTFGVYGASSNVVGWVRLKDLNGNVVNSQEIEVDFLNKTQTYGGRTESCKIEDDTAQGIDGFKAFANDAYGFRLVMPTYNPELYYVELQTLFDTIRLNIGYDINPIV